MSRKLTDRQAKRIKKELEVNYEDEKARRKRRREEKVTRPKDRRKRKVFRDIDEVEDVPFVYEEEEEELDDYGDDELDDDR